MASNNLIVKVVTPVAGSRLFSFAGAVFSFPVKVTRESRVQWRKSTNAGLSDNEYFYSPFGTLYFATSNPFNGTEKVVIIYRNLII